tara:strand:+ start:206 stop:337 length:132 start_codon:yes stop_codon:yes gene_type:complete
MVEKWYLWHGGVSTIQKELGHESPGANDYHRQYHYKVSLDSSL